MFRQFLSYLSVVLLVSMQLASTVPVYCAVTVPIGSATTQAASPVVITPGSATKLTDLTVPKGGTLIIDFSNSNQFTASGDVNNAGTIYGISSNPQISNVILSANNIFNNSGALLTTILPNTAIQGLPYNINQLVGNLSLTLNALNNVVNSGVISSAGNLNIYAGGSIINTTQVMNTVNSAASQAALMSAVNNLNLTAANIVNSGAIASQLGTITAATAQMTNSGILQALQGNVNIQNLIGNTLNINNAMGTIAAQNILDISALNTSNSALSELIVSGGTLAGNHVNFAADKMSITVDAIKGPVSARGCAAAIESAGPLEIASLNLSGDPLISSGSNLDLSGLFAGGSRYATYGADFIALAGGNITALTAPKGAEINAQAQKGPGGQIYLSAGTQYSILNPLSVFSDHIVLNKDFKILGESSSGGSIKLANVSLVTNNSPITLNAYGVSGENARPQLASNVAGSIQIGDIFVCCNKSATTPTTTLPAVSEAKVVEPKLADVTLTSTGLSTVSNITNVCGSIKVNAGDFDLLSGSNLQAFHGGVSINSSQGINLEGNNKVSSVGGDLQLNANESVNVGSASYLGAFSTEAVPSVNLQITSGGDFNSQGNNNFVVDKGTLDIRGIGPYSSITTGEHDTFRTWGGNLNIEAYSNWYYYYPRISLGNENTLTATDGRVYIYSRGPLTVGNDTRISSFESKDNYGGLYLGSSSNLELGNRVKLDSVGGYLEVWGDNLYTGYKDSFRAFPGANKNDWMYVGSSNYTSIGDSNYFEGSQIELYSSSTLRTGRDLLVEAPKSEDRTANIYVYGWNNGIYLGENNKFTADGNINLYSYRWINTGRNNEFRTCDGSITLESHPYYYWYGDGGVNIGANNKFNARGGDISVSVNPYYWYYWYYYPHNINIGQGSVFNAEKHNGAGGNVRFSTDYYGTIQSIGSGNGEDEERSHGPALTVNANGGDATFSSGAIYLGENSIVNAFASRGDSEGTASGGNVVLSASRYIIETGARSNFNAVGGDINFSAPYITLGEKNVLNAFSRNRCEDQPAASGDINLTASDTISVGSHSRFNAVGGNVSINSDWDTINLSPGTTIFTFSPERGAGNVSLSAGASLNLEDITIAADRNVNITSRYDGVTLTGVTIAAGNAKSGGDWI
jgi:hypothetical protein